MKDLFVVSSSALPSGHRVIGFRGLEVLSQTYEFSIDLMIGRDAELDLETMLGERLTLTLDREDDRGPMQWHGVIADVELVHELAEAGVYTLMLVPAVWQLSLAHHSRIFVDETTPSIIAAVLKENGIETSDYELRLSATYKKLEHVCQYEETDLAFISRWMEREGIYYFFEQGEEHEKLIVTDDRSHHQELLPGSVRYVPQAGGGYTAGEALHAIVVKHARLPSSVKVQDYDYMRPDLDVVADAAVAPRGTGSIRLYGENFTAPDEAKRLAKVRAQALSSRKKIFHANGTAMHLRPGYVFTLDEHPRPAFNTKYLTIALVHVGNQAAHAMGVQDLLGYESDAVYRCKLSAIPASAQYRPDRATPMPRIDGAVSAVIDGPADSPYAQIDKQGRYKIRVKFDEGEPDDGKGSMYVRMMQPHGGTAEGFHFPLRKGTEVMLIFMGGDPDQPIIAGVVPNAHKPSVVTGENHTKNVINTGGQNRLEMEDAEGSQHTRISTPTADTYIHMGSPRDGFHLVQNTDGNAFVNTKGDRKLTTAKNKREEVYFDVFEHFGKNHTTTLTLNRTSVIGGHRELTIIEEDTKEVHADASADYQTNFTTHVGGIVVETYDGNHVTAVAGETQRSSDQKETVLVAERKETINGDCNQTINGKSVQTITGDAFRTVMGSVNETCMSPESSLKLDTESSMFFGAKSSLTMAVEGEISIGGKLSYSLSHETSISGSMKTEISLSASFTMEAGVAFELANAPSISKYAIDIETATMKIVQ